LQRPGRRRSRRTGPSPAWPCGSPRPAADTMSDSFSMPVTPVSQQSAGFVAQETGSPRRALLLQGLTVGQQVFRSLLRPVTIMFRRQRGLRIWRGSDRRSSRGMGRPLEQQLPWMRPHITRVCCSRGTDIHPRVLYMVGTVNTGDLGGPSYEEVLTWKCGACGDACRTCSNGSGHAAPAASSARGVL
jgi:hypothetical protein